MLALQEERRWLILPIETKVRELDGKILLAAMAAERGWGVILGHKDTIVQDTAGMKAVVLEKDGHRGNYRVKQFSDSGKTVCILDEEGLVYHNALDYYRRRLDLQNHQRAEVVFTWGEVQRRDVLQHLPIAAGKLSPTGNPRFDLLRPEFREYYRSEAIQLKDRYGPFILVNTNFGESNHYMGTEWLLNTHRRSGFIANARDEEEELAYIAYQGNIARAFREMIPLVSAAYPQYRIIVRPHPSENHQTWKDWARNLKRVSVIHQGDVNPWLLAADLSIHNSCMTGIQGYLLDKPVIAYMPTLSEQFDFYLPNAISQRAASPQEVISAIQGFLTEPSSSHPEDMRARIQVAEQYISAMSGHFATERILSLLETLPVEPQPYHPPEHDPLATGSSNQPGVLTGLYQDLKRRVSQARLPKAQKIQLAYARQKFQGISLDEVQKRFLKLQVAARHFTGIRVHQHGENNFYFLREE